MQFLPTSAASKARLIGCAIALLLAGLCHGQIFISGPTSSLRTLTGWSETPLSVQDVAETASRARYLVGKVGTESYLVRLGKNGNLRFAKRIGPAASKALVAVSGESHVYVVLTTNAGTEILSFDGNGVLAASTTLPSKSRVNAITTLPDGEFYTCGTISTEGDTHSVAGVTRWVSNLSQELPVTSGTRDLSEFYDVDTDADGNALVAGRDNLDSTITFVQLGLFVDTYTLNMSFTETHPGLQYKFTNIAVDKSTGVFMATGTGQNDETGLYPVVWASGKLDSVSIDTERGKFCENGEASNLITDSAGHFVATTTEFKPTGRFEVQARLFSVRPYSVVEPMFVKTFAGDRLEQGSPFCDSEGVFGVIGWASRTDHRPTLYSWYFDGIDLERTPLGNDADDPQNFGRVSYSSATNELFAVTGSASNGPLTVISNLASGPDDKYMMFPASTLSVPASSGVLVNDAPGVPPGDLTCELVSIGKGLKSVTLRPDGSFDVKKKPTFRAFGTFTYMLKRNGTPVHTANVSIDCGPPGPTANTDTFTIPRDQIVLIDVLANDTEPNGQALTLVTWNKTYTYHLARIRLTPDHKQIQVRVPLWWVDEVHFTYTVRNQDGKTATGDVWLHVN